jgi:hypothetical protein
MLAVLMGHSWEMFHSQLQRLFFMALATGSDAWQRTERDYWQQGEYFMWNM